MRKCLLVMLVLTGLGFKVHASSPAITWNLGSVDIVWNHMTEGADGEYHGNQIALSLIDFQFHFVNNRLGLQTSLLKLSTDLEDNSLFTMFPVEVSFNVLKSDIFLLGPYARGEIYFADNGIHPFGEAGIKFGSMVIKDPNKLKYSWRCSVYAGYDSHNRINIGTQIDIGVLGLLALIEKSKEDT